MEVIILNLLLLKFSASIMASNISQKIFTKVAEQGECRIEKIHRFYDSINAAV